jgi:hypothetical protein
MMKVLLKALALTVASLTPILSWGVNPHDEYYTDDIFTAINEAKKRPHHYDYSNAKRYNRSTTQSLDIPRLLNKEMGITSIDSRDENSISAEDTPVGKQQPNQYKVKDNNVAGNSVLPINTVTPTIGNPNVQSPNITTNIIAR